MTEKPPRIVFMGTPAFAVPSLEACRQLGEVVAVLTQPDKPKGRGQEVVPGAVKLAAERAGLEVWQPAKLKGTDVGARLKQLAPDVCVVAAYGKILPLDVLDAATHGCINVHASLLPRWRGAAPIQWAIAAGDAETGVTLMRLELGLDTGPTFARVATPIGPQDTSESLHDRLSQMGAALLLEALPGYLAGQRVPEAQPKEGVTLAPPLQKEQGRLDFSLSSPVLERRIRAFTPWPGAFTELGPDFGGKRLKILEAQTLRQVGSGAPGSILQASASGIDVQCVQDALRILRLQPEGRRTMTAAEFLAGHPLKAGQAPFVRWGGAST